MDEQTAPRRGLAAALEAHRPEILRFLSARCGDAAEAEDLLQELWLKLRGVDTGPIANARAYLFRMANNLVLDQRRGQQRAMRRDRGWLDADGVADGAIEDRPDPAPSAEATLQEKQEHAALKRAIDGLPPGAKRALVLFRFDGLGQAEIAEIMQISRSGVEKHLALAMKKLREALADCGSERSAASHSTGDPDGRAPKPGIER